MTIQKQNGSGEGIYNINTLTNYFQIYYTIQFKTYGLGCSRILADRFGISMASEIVTRYFVLRFLVPLKQFSRLQSTLGQCLSQW